MNVPKSAIERKLSRAVAKAVHGFDMIQDGDRILVALSGGKDSYVLFHLLDGLSQRAPIHFTIVAVHVDQRQPGHDPRPLIEFFADRGYELHVEKDDTYSVVRNKVPHGKSDCSLCARLRRAILYRLADEKRCNKVALGHHRDDAIVTLMLNLIFSGQLKAMPPKLVSDDGKHVVIRPLIYCAEDVIQSFSLACKFPVLPCGLCGTQPDQQRQAINKLLAELDARHPGARANMLAALGNVRASHLLDPGLWKALGLRVANDDDSDGRVIPTEQLTQP
ncbi:MAG: tRNA 2-thiocytidine(32) synthetase TtcA [Sorangium cellulosum]|nr:MAG: tRNA 2-thiocytidine(32) synthetase TtcA [Sorangium cellulosum]